MQTPAMTNAHEKHSQEARCLPARSVFRLSSARSKRWLSVDEGRVWLTRSQHTLGAGEDVWLSAGQCLALPAGSEWVAEGWPEARVRILCAPRAGLGTAASRGPHGRGLGG